MILGVVWIWNTILDILIARDCTLGFSILIGSIRVFSRRNHEVNKTIHWRIVLGCKSAHRPSSEASLPKHANLLCPVPLLNFMNGRLYCRGHRVNTNGLEYLIVLTNWRLEIRQSHVVKVPLASMLPFDDDATFRTASQFRRHLLCQPHHYLANITGFTKLHRWETPNLGHFTNPKLYELISASQFSEHIPPRVVQVFSCYSKGIHIRFAPEQTQDLGLEVRECSSAL